MIQVSDLSFSYPGQTEVAIRGLDFSIAAGEIFGFLGPSGAGKTTTQKILFKLLTGYTGSALIDGKEVRDWDIDLYHRIGVSFELPNHYLKLTALENLDFFGAFYQKHYRTAMELLAMVGMENAANQKVGAFSKGMKMRLNFVRALQHDPEILFLDEPTSGMDPANAHLIKNLIRQLQQEGKTIFITTHQMHDAQELCDRVAFLVDGRIRALDTPQALQLAYSNKTVEVHFREGDLVKSYGLNGLGANEEFLQDLQQMEIVTIHSREASLDAVFMEVTGKSLV
ncbi:MAG: ABC transporter ATP-binding protein [Saprospiraceae bacterium]|nr:ABC transporter ATP-binding protein [Saprospiraceae bacterium]MCB9317941.1 ABC transporter ATP-binding protein [Lewinellaceae bacterium]